MELNVGGVNLTSCVLGILRRNYTVSSILSKSMDGFIIPITAITGPRKLCRFKVFYISEMLTHGTHMAHRSPDPRSHQTLRTHQTHGAHNVRQDTNKKRGYVMSVTNQHKYI